MTQMTSGENTTDRHIHANFVRGIEPSSIRRKKLVQVDLNKFIVLVQCYLACVRAINTSNMENNKKKTGKEDQRACSGK